MANRPKGPAKRDPMFVCGALGPVIGVIYWRPWGRSAPLKWWRRHTRVRVTNWQAYLEWREHMAQRPALNDMPRLADLGAGYGSWEKLCPELATWLCDGTYSDGSAKGDVTISLRRNVTTVVAMLKVEDGGLCLRASGDTPDDALVALELLLTADRCPWEVDPYPLGGGRKKKK